MAERIEKRRGKIQVPENPMVPFIEGDGIGPDIWKTTVRVLDAAVEKAYQGKRQIAWREVYAGEKAFSKTGQWLPKETEETIRECLVGIKGPLTTPVGEGFRSLNVTLRQHLDLFVCLRPVKYYEGTPSPVKKPHLIDMVVFRENTEDVYAGLETPEGTPPTKALLTYLEKTLGWRIREDSGIAIKPISITATERLVRAAIRYALHHERKSVTLVHKGNIMKYTEGAFRSWGYALAKREFPREIVTWAECPEGQVPEGKLLIKDVIADAFLQQILTRPSEYDVIATMNLNGDYLSDALAAQVGGIGIAPGANINFDTGVAVFEATHGTAPKYAGLNKVNPGSLILSGKMMLEYMGWQDAAELIERGMSGAIRDRRVTYDFARLMEGSEEVSCSRFGDCLIEKMKG